MVRISKELTKLEFMTTEEIQELDKLGLFFTPEKENRPYEAVV